MIILFLTFFINDYIPIMTVFHKLCVLDSQILPKIINNLSIIQCNILNIALYYR